MVERTFYVETSVWGMIPKGQPREMRRASLQFLRQVPQPSLCMSEIVMQEIDLCSESDRSQIMEVLSRSAPTRLDVTQECHDLARYYVESGILSPRKPADAVHVAISTFHEVTVLVSWNHRHLANVRKAELYRGANLIRGYPNTPLILTPLEVLHA